MLKVMAFALMLTGSIWAVEVTFNDYPDDVTDGDRANTNTLNRLAVGGMIKNAQPDLPGDCLGDGYYNHCSAGSFDMDGTASGQRRKCAYYYNPGIQEFGSLGNSSANVTSAYLWGKRMDCCGAAGALGITAGATTVPIDWASLDEPIWDGETVPFIYNQIVFGDNSTNHGQYLGYANGTDWLNSLDDAKAAGHAIEVTNAVKYIMDNASNDALGIVCKSDSGSGQIGIPAAENGAEGWYGFAVLLTINYNGTPVLGIESNATKSAALSLQQNSPNPFVGGTTINFNVPGRQNAKLAIYTVGGQLVKTLVDGTVSGAGSVHWNGTDNMGNKLNSGVYIYKLTAGNRSMVKKMILMQ